MWNENWSTLGPPPHSLYCSYDQRPVQAEKLGFLVKIQSLYIPMTSLLNTQGFHFCSSKLNCFTPSLLQTSKHPFSQLKLSNTQYMYISDSGLFHDSSSSLLFKILPFFTTLTLLALLLILNEAFICFAMTYHGMIKFVH